MEAHKKTSWTYLILLGLVAATTPDLLYAGLKGKFKKGVYTAPDKNFSVELPKGTRVTDAYDKGGKEAMVEFVDRGGGFKAVWCTPFEPPKDLEGRLTNEAFATKFMSSYFKDVVMPWIFYPISHESVILSESLLSFDGASAYLFLVKVPGAAGLYDPLTNKHYDGRRPTLVFSKCGYTYIVVHELVTGHAGVAKLVHGDVVPVEVIQEDMADGERVLREFIGTIRFSGCPE